MNEIAFVPSAPDDSSQREPVDGLRREQPVDRTRTLERRVAELERELEVNRRFKDEFLCTVSHELRTPLTVMLGWTHLLRAKHLDEAARQKALDAIERNGRGQAQLIDDLLDVARLMGGNLVLQMRPVALADTVGTVLAALDITASGKGIEVVRELEEPGTVRGDRRKLQQIVFAILSNALRFTQPGGQVRVRLARVDGWVELTVRDSGIGISANLLPYVFDHFVQGHDPQRPSRGGLGLGLTLVRHLVEAHGGTVTATSAGEGEGATIAVRLPLAKRRRSWIGISERRKRSAHAHVSIGLGTTE